MNKRLFAAALLLSLLFRSSALAAAYPAPTGFEDGSYDREIVFWLPSTTEGEIVQVRDRLRFSTSYAPEETALRQLLSYSADSGHLPLPGDGGIMLADGISFILSCGTAIVNLSLEFEYLSEADRYLFAQCVTNTICGLGRAEAVVFLCEGSAVSLSDQETIPAGAFRQSDGLDLPLVQALLMARRSEETALRYSADTALFYPAQAGRGILCETRAVSFPEPGEEQAVLTLLEALSQPPETLLDVPQLPELTDYLTEAPLLIPVDDDHRSVVLRFSEALNQQISSRGVLRSVLLAGITSTLTAFLPDIASVVCYIGRDRVTSLVPVGLYEGANDSIVFQDGNMRWNDFAYFHLTECRLYFLNDRDQLTESVRSLPAAWADSPIQLLGALLDGPSYYDSMPNLHSAVPDSATPDDILGLDSVRDICLVNLSGRLIGACEGYSLAEERNFVYAIVNTLTCLPWCGRVELYVDGQQPDMLISQLALPGGFMRNADYAREQ